MTGEKTEFVKQWIEKAEEDMRAFRLLIEEELPLTAIAGFHLQQSAEKYLKALLEYNNISFAKTHDIEYLLQLCAQINESFTEINPGNLTDYAVDLRYPGDNYVPSVKELKDSLGVTEDIKKLVLTFIKL